MSPSYTLPIAALVASVFLLFTAHSRLAAAFAVVASGLELLVATGTIAVHMGATLFHVVLGAVLLVAGVLAYLRVSAKAAVSAATVLALVGLSQVVHILHRTWT